MGGEFEGHGLPGDRIGLVEEVVEDLALSPQVPGMPLPTGYGLQVKGPDAEDILIPVCLPPGFELGSLVLKPSFLPDEEHAAAQAHESAPVAQSMPVPVMQPAPAAPAAPAAPGDRLGEAIQLVYSEESGFRTGGEGLVARPPAVPERDTSLL